MHGEITLVRHAKVKIDNDFIYASDMDRWIEKYNTTPIEKLSTLSIPKADIYVASTLKRSSDTLKALGFCATISDTIFNEAELPYMDQQKIKLHAKFWIILFRLAWLFGYNNHSESYNKAKKRADIAADKLVNLAQNNHSVLLMGHGIINRLIIKSLKNKGWKIIRQKGPGNGEHSTMKYKNLL